MKKIIIIVLLSILFINPPKAMAQTATNALGNATVEDGMGVQIHFTTGHLADLDMIQRAGFKRVRMDFFWNKCELEKGVYNFKEYDELVSNLKKRGLKPVFTLDFGNPLYGENWSIKKAETRKAFADFAANAVENFKNDEIIWEIWYLS